MVIDINNGNAVGTSMDQRLRGDCGIIEKTISTTNIGSGVMSWRPGQPKHRTVISLKSLRSRERNFRRCQCCLPGSGGKRRTRVIGEIAQTAEDTIRKNGTQTTANPNMWNGIALLIRIEPFLVDTLQERKVFVSMDTPQWRETELRGFHDVAKVCRFHGINDEFRASDRLVIRYHLPAVQFSLRAVEDVLW